MAENVCQVPSGVEIYLTPLAVWVKHNGVCTINGLTLSTFFTYKECEYVTSVLDKIFNIKASVIEKANKQYSIYVEK